LFHNHVTLLKVTQKTSLGWLTKPPLNSGIPVGCHGTIKAYMMLCKLANTNTTWYPEIALLLVGNHSHCGITAPFL